MAKIFITQFDVDRLKAILEKKLRLDDYDQALLAELNQAEIVEPSKIPSDVVTMKSNVRLKEDSGNVSEYLCSFSSGVFDHRIQSWQYNLDSLAKR